MSGKDLPVANFDLTSTPPVAKTVSEVRKKVASARKAGRLIGFVPTMGALHAGHLSLLEASVRRELFTVASIYVNPTQFAPHEDLNRYPRPFAADHEKCGNAGVELVFAPDDETMYPPNDETRVRPGKLAEGLCGPFRPGHFEGVCTVVARLFNIVQPDVAFFGQKDAQQARIIKRMAADLHFPIEIAVCPLMREPDGLAMSSRNAYLSEKERHDALCLFSALSAGWDALVSGTSVVDVEPIMRQEILRTISSDQIEYLCAVDHETLSLPTAETRQILLAGAIRIGATRLIDNIVVDRPSDRT